MATMSGIKICAKCGLPDAGMVVTGLIIPMCRCAWRNNVVTIPDDKLAELQRKAKLADELLLILFHARDDIQYYADKAVENIDLAIAKAKEQSCSTLCHPEEECFITESGKCEAKGE